MLCKKNLNATYHRLYTKDIHRDLLVKHLFGGGGGGVAFPEIKICLITKIVLLENWYVLNEQISRSGPIDMTMVISSVARRNIGRSAPTSLLGVKVQKIPIASFRKATATATATSEWYMSVVVVAVFVFLQIVSESFARAGLVNVKSFGHFLTFSTTVKWSKWNRSSDITTSVRGLLWVHAFA